MPPLRTLSPRYTQKGSSPMNDSAHRIAWAMPAGNPWTTYVIRTPWALPSPRSSCTFSGIRSPRITPMSVMPASRRSSRQYRMFGLFASGISCFGPVCVSGRSRVPWPPARMSPFMPTSGLESRRRHKAIEASLPLHGPDTFVRREDRDPMALRLRARERGVRGPRRLHVEVHRTDRLDHGGVEAEGVDEAHRE